MITLNRLKITISLVSALLITAGILSSCGAQPPTEAVTTATEIVEMKDTYGLGDSSSGKETTAESGEDEKSGTTAASADGTTADVSQSAGVTAATGKTSAASETSAAGENTTAAQTEKSTAGETTEKREIKTTDVEFEVQSYYKCGDNYASIENIRFDDSIIASNANGFVDLRMVYVGNNNTKFRIAYKAYDANGKVVRNTFVMAKLDGVKSGDVVTGVRFDVPYNTVKVVFEEV